MHLFGTSMTILSGLNLVIAQPYRLSNPLRSQDLGNSETPVWYNTNWAGAVLNGTGVTSVSALVVVGKAEMPAGGKTSTEYSTTTWVGIDGTVACDSWALLQTGVTTYVQNGKTRYEAWYEWSPEPYIPFKGFVVGFGDTINMTVTATSATSGVAIIQNLSTGKSITQKFTGQAALCQNSAEWIVENFGSLVEQYPFANFTTVAFTNTTATVGGKTPKLVDNTGSGIYGIKKNEKARTECLTPSSSTVTCRFLQ